MTSQKPTYDDIAQAMPKPVSPKTISWAMNNVQGVAQETKERILKAAREVNYQQPNRSRTPTRKKPGRIGVCTPDIDGSYYQELTRNISWFSSQVGFDVVPQITHDSLAEENAAMLFNDIGVKAIVFLSSRISDLHFRQLADDHGTLLIGLGSPRPSNDFGDILIDIDHYFGMYQATKYLIELGHKQIAFFSGPENSASNTQKKTGMEGALAEHDLGLSDDFILRPEKPIFDYQAGLQLATEVLQWAKQERPTAIVCYNDELAIGAMAGLAQHGLNVPNDVSIIGYDNIPVGAYLNPRLTSIGVPREDLALCAVQIIQRTENRGTVLQDPAPFKPVLRKRSSTAAPPLISQ